MPLNFGGDSFEIGGGISNIYVRSVIILDKGGISNKGVNDWSDDEISNRIGGVYIYGVPEGLGVIDVKGGIRYKEDSNILVLMEFVGIEGEDKIEKMKVKVASGGIVVMSCKFCSGRYKIGLGLV